MNFFWRRVHERLRSGENVFVALVVKHTIHSPGTTGARLAVFESEEIIGTIGGGVMERNLAQVATGALRTGSKGSKGRARPGGDYEPRRYS